MLGVGFELVDSVQPADWIKERLVDRHKRPGHRTVNCVIPEGFEAYARIYHRVEHMLPDGSWEPLRWATVAEWYGTVVHPSMTFPEIARLQLGGPGVPDQQPPSGLSDPFRELTDDECRSLMGVLEGFTETPGKCYFALWRGYGFLDGRDLRQLLGWLGAWRARKAVTRLPERGEPYLVFRGPLDSVMAFYGYVGERYWGTPPNIWWPEDRAWCVASDIDTQDTIVGGSRACIDALLGNPDLETLPTVLTDVVDW